MILQFQTDRFHNFPKQDLTRGRLLDLPGGIVLVGGTAIMPGVVEVAQRRGRKIE